MTSNSVFTSILDFPSGFADPFTVSACGKTLGQFSPGQSVNFATACGGGVADFTITGIQPQADTANILAFPLQIAFNTPSAQFDMLPIVQSVQTPEPSTLLLVGCGLVTLSALTWRRSRSKYQRRFGAA